MTPDQINKNFFSSNTRGYKIINRFYYKYSDLFSRTLYSEFRDFLNQIFLIVSAIDFSKGIKNQEAYIIGTIKIQCRVLLDRAIRTKNIIPQSQLVDLTSSDNESILENYPDNKTNDEIFNNIEEEEIYNQLNIFKLGLNNEEIKMLNYLIDEKPRSEIAEDIKMNINTVDTRIRRLRVKFSKFLKLSGYSDKIPDRYS